MLVMQAEPPFALFRATFSTCTIRKIIDEVVPPRMVDQGPRIPPAWRAVALVNVMGELWVTFADLRSDERILLVLGQDGSTIRHTRVDVPFSVVESTGEEVVALRSIDGQEIVTYRVGSRSFNQGSK
jgi:hypothetical protein